MIPTNPLNELIDILNLLRDNPYKAADRLEDMGRRLIALADNIRSHCDNGTKGTRDNGSMGDRVQMNVVGPDGQIKQRSDTGEIK